MLRLIIRSCLNFRLLVVGAAVAVMLVGVTQLRNDPVDVLPEFTPPYVEIQTEALGLSAEEVEQLVTVPLEADLLNGTKGVTVLRSESVPGASSIVLLFEPGTKIYDARQLVQEQLTQAHANPNVSQPPQMLQPLSSESRLMLIGLSPARMSEIEASVLARWTIRPRLLGVDGVANVAIFGARDRQLQVLVDPERLRRDSVSLLQVISTAGNAQLVSPLSFLEASTPGTGGFIDTANQRLQVRHILPSVTPATLARVPLDPPEDATSTTSGPPRRLGDVTDVVEDHQPLIGDAIVRGRPGLLLAVEKFPGANTLEVTRGVEEALDEMRPGLSGLRIDSPFRAADFVEAATDNLTVAIIAGCALLVLALLALLRSWRTALVCVIAFVLALTTAALVLSITDATMNALVFAGLAAAVGAVIDDAVVGAQNIRRRLAEGGRENSTGRAETVLSAAVEMRGPLGYATVIVALTALPVLFIQGVTGAFVEPVVRAYLLALAASMLVALTVTPALSLFLFSKPRGERGGSRLARWASGRYRAALAGVVGRPRAAYVAGAAVLLAGVALVPALHGPLIPAFKDNALLVRLDGPPGTSRPEMARILTAVSRDVRAVPGVRDVGGHVGRAVTGDQVVDVNSSELWVTVDPHADYAATRASVQRVVDGYPGFSRSVLTYAKQRIRDVAATDDRQGDDAPARSADLDVLTGADRRPLVVRIFGEDLGVLRREGARMQRMLSTVDGVVNPRVERSVVQPTVAIEVDLARAQRYGLKPGDVRRAAATLLSGIQVGSLFEQQKVFEVVVRATPGVRKSVTDMRRLLIDTPTGGHVRLGSIADVRVRPTPQIIQRDASSRRIDVNADVSGRGLGDVQRDVKERLRHVGFPLEYHAEVLGDPTGPQSTAKRLLGFALAAAVGIFLLLQAAFRSWRLASAVFLALPVALVGGELAAVLDGGAVSLGSLVGLLAVLGIAARNCVVLGMHYDHLQRREGEVFRPHLILRGAGDRLGPIVLAASATAAVLLPVVLLGDRPGYEIVHPMAVVILGGLVTSTLLSLLLIPALYARFGPSPEPGSAGEPTVVRQWGGAEPAPAGVPDDVMLSPYRQGAQADPRDGDGNRIPTEEEW